MRRAVYTCLFGDTDDLKEPVEVTPGVDYICFTNRTDLNSSVWEIKQRGWNFGDNKRQSRFFKILPPDGYDQTLYVDATFKIKHDLIPLLKNKTEGIWLFKHPQRNCAYVEADIVKSKKLDKESTIVQQIGKYEREGFPPNYGLWRCGIVIRDSRNAKLNETWISEIVNGSWRDQISFPYACWKTGVTPKPILASLTDYYFEQSLHKPHTTPYWKHFGNDVPNWDLIVKHPLVHLIVTDQALYFPQWLNNYISVSHGREKFIELVKTLNGVVVYE